MATHSGPRVGIREGPPNCGRGWRVLREQWRDYLQKRVEIPGQVLSDHKVKLQPIRPCDLGLNKEGVDRMLDKIMSSLTGDTPRSQKSIQAWRRAEQLNTEMRTLIAERLPQKQIAGRRAEAKKVPHPSMAFFPQDWSNALSEESVAELIVDAFTSVFCDAFIDGAVSIVDVSRKWHPSGMQHSASEPLLEHPRATMRLRNTLHTDKRLLDSGFDGKDEASATDGFTMAGLTNDQWEAWNQRNFHRCKPLEPFTRRIEKATQMQRPNRRITRPRASSLAESEKFVWPMTQSHFPDQWENSTYRERKRQLSLVPTDEEEELEGNWLMRIGRDGKTTFPYSLVSHRAFLDSLRDPVLKAKAAKAAPLKFTNGA